MCIRDSIRELLSGKMGNIKEVNPMLFASLYGLNRYATLPLLRYWRQRGAIVVLDRYFTANFGHQASKYTDETDRINAIKTLSTLSLIHISEPTRLLSISYAVFCLKKKNHNIYYHIVSHI
eukprot:TRINITY_DN42082_c0_g1_i1.p1 TRINITY_DN42082_c0_g1~~TRINITY_DN42082_c0_g1_i1.p1  ORF type:complete len:121 (+),score=33.65 TRINITY_DN42082_c0_g1_i1:101-463(+)